MRVLTAAVLAMLGLLLGGCGGGGGHEAESARAGPALRALAETPATATASLPTERAERLLDYGQAGFPMLFPGPWPTASVSASPFLYRHFPETGTYLGVVTGAGAGFPLGGVFVLGGAFGGVPLQVGTVSDFIVDDPLRGFVTRSGTRFMLDGRTFRVAGANAAQVIANVDRSGARNALVLARGMGANVVRIFGGSEIGSLDTHAGGSVRTLGSDPAWRPWFQAWDPLARRAVFNEAANGLEHLDYVIYVAREQGLRVIVTLVDNWDFFYGGVNQYLLWHGRSAHGDFFTDPAIRQSYKAWTSHLLNRVNRYTGTRYADEPAIMAWELINEPSCYGGEAFPATASCHRTQIEQWIAEMSAHVKALAPRQLVAVGDQGHFGTRDDPAMGWPYRSSNEPDFETVLRLPNIDFGTYHLYPHDFAHGDGSLSPLAWGLRYLRDREAVARSVGKPALMEEFGARDAGLHASVFETWLDALDREGGAGFLFWGIGARFDSGGTVWDSQGYTIYPDSPGGPVLRRWLARFNPPPAN
jgi:mannan endo-1,4-beta-mannosidase